MIGLSLSFCIMDICCGDVVIENVEKIVASTCCRNDAEFREVLKQYKKTYWHEFPDKAEKRS